MSKLYFARPVTLSGPSRRFTRVLSTAGFAGHAYFFAFSVGPAAAGGGAPRPSCALATSHPPRRQLAARGHCGFHDAYEGAAAADVAVEPLLHLFRRRLRMLFEQRDRRHHEARRAEAAHQRIAIAERLLHRVKLRAVGQTVDGANLLAHNFNRKRRTRILGLAVDDHRARAADTSIAAALVAGEIGLVADGVQQRHPRFDTKRDAFAVHHQLDRHLARTDDRRTALRFDHCGARNSRRERRDASRLQELAASSIDRLGFFGIFVLWHATALKRKGTQKPGKYTGFTGD